MQINPSQPLHDVPIRIDRTAAADHETRPLLTRAEHDLYRRQLEELRRIRERDLPRLLRDARTFVASDAAEEIVQIGVDQAVADRRIAQLEALLHDAAVVDDDAPAGDVVALGRSVVVQYTRTGARMTFRIGGIAGGTRDQFVSARSPVGQALLGRARGDLVSVTLPAGNEEELLIVSVSG